MNKITVSAKTYDEAITKALIQLGTTSDHLEVEIIEKGSGGLFGILGGRPWTISARVKTEEEEKKEQELKEREVREQASKKEETKKKELEAKEKELKEELKGSEPKRDKEKSSVGAEISAEKKNFSTDHGERRFSEKSERLSRRRRPGREREFSENAGEESVGREVLQEEAEDIKKIAISFLCELFRLMKTEVQIDADFNYQNNELSLILSGEDMGVMIGKRGQTLDALQYLTSLVVNKHRDVYIRVKLDSENYRERREQKLRSLARNIARKVKQTRRPVSLEPMNPYERRIIHSALQKDPYVTTLSEGEDPYRHVVVILKKEQKKRIQNQED